MIQQRKFHSGLLFVFLALIISSCEHTPNSKEDYLQKFDEFVDMVEQDYKSFSEETWERKDRIYKNFSEKWYMKYKEQLAFKEEILVKKNMIKYQIYRNNKDLKDSLKQGIEALKEVGEDFLEVIETTGDSIIKNLDIDIDTK